MTRGNQPRTLAVLIDRLWPRGVEPADGEKKLPRSVTRKRRSGMSRAVLSGFAASVHRSRRSKAGRELA